jgi:hypothetical protein
MHTTTLRMGILHTAYTYILGGALPTHGTWTYAHVVMDSLPVHTYRGTTYDEHTMYSNGYLTYRYLLRDSLLFSFWFLSFSFFTFVNGLFIYDNGFLKGFLMLQWIPYRLLCS